MVSRLSLQERSEGELAFPDLATLDRAVRDEKNRRLKSDREKREREAEELEARERRDHPEKYIPFDLAAMLDEVKSRKGETAQTRAEVKSKGVRCAHCGASRDQPYYRALTPSQLRELANVIERQEAVNSHSN